jgi:hypothetical protein
MTKLWGSTSELGKLRKRAHIKSARGEESSIESILKRE